MYRRTIYLISILSLLSLVSNTSAALVGVPYVGDGGANWNCTGSITARAASINSPTFPASKTVDGSGLDVTGSLHAGGAPYDMYWISVLGGGGSSANHPLGLDCSTWIEYEFDQVYELATMWVWNFNMENGTKWMKRGLQKVYVDYSIDGIDWTRLMNGADDFFIFPQALTAVNYEGFAGPDFAGASARHVLITADKTNGNYGGDKYGLSEVRFYQVPEPSTLALLGVGGYALLRMRRLR